MIRGQARPRKRFGQHFLEPAWVAKVIDALHATKDDTFLEIGPGRGALTRPLAARAGRVIAIEIDRDLAAALADEEIPNLRLLQSDVLGVDLREALRGEARPLRVAGNLPYNVASPILFALLDVADNGRFLSDATLMLQKEVADRLVAKPGRKEYGGLAIQVAVAADVAPAHAAARRLPAAAEGDIRRRPSPFPPADGRCRGPQRLRAHRPRHLSAAPEDAGQRASPRRRFPGPFGGRTP